MMVPLNFLIEFNYNIPPVYANHKNVFVEKIFFEKTLQRRITNLLMGWEKVFS